MKKVLAFAGSNSPTSINHQLIEHVSARISEHSLEVLKLRDLEFPMFSISREREGIPSIVQFLFDKIQQNSALIISVNENNRNVSAFFKNIIDWLSRVERKFLQDKKILLMSTSPGQHGGAAALEYCKTVFPRFGGIIVESFSLPHFYENFDTEKGLIVNEIIDMGVMDVVTSFSQQIKD